MRNIGVLLSTQQGDRRIGADSEGYVYLDRSLVGTMVEVSRNTPRLPNTYSVSGPRADASRQNKP